jgi:hypothetical protein
MYARAFGSISRDAEYYSDIASGSDSLGFDNRIRFILRFV